MSAAALRRTPAAEVADEDGPFKAAAHGDEALRRLELPRGYVPHAKQRILHWLGKQPGVDVIVVNAGRRSGKSEGAAAQFGAGMLRDWRHKRLGLGRWEGRPAPAWRPQRGKAPSPFLHYVAVAPVYALLDPCKRKLRRMLGHVEDPGGGWIAHQTDQTWWLLGGVRIDWRTGDRPERLVAEAYDGYWGDEGARLKAAIWEEHLQPALADSGGWALHTSTPLGKANWFYRLWALGDPHAAAELADDTGEDVRRDPRVKCVSWTSMDNTAMPKVIEMAQAMRSSMPEAMWRRSFLADWDAFVGQCFSLSEATHLRRVPLVGLRHFSAGMDFGWTNPAVVALVGKDYDGGVHEVAAVSRRETIIDSDDAWRDKDRDRSTWTCIAYQLMRDQGLDYRRVPLYLPPDDPAAHRLFRARGFDVRQAYTDRLAGLTWLQMMAHNGRISFGSRVVYRSFASLRFPDGKAGRDAELWDKRCDDHAFDATRYALSDEIQRGDFIANPALLRSLGRR